MVIQNRGKQMQRKLTLDDITITTKEIDVSDMPHGTDYVPKGTVIDGYGVAGPPGTPGCPHGEQPWYNKYTNKRRSRKK